MDCLFCKIINGEIPSQKIYEDDLVLCFLDINPTTNGDMLIVPKKHYLDFNELDDEIILHINTVAKELYPKFKENLKCDGLTLCTNADYGQEIKHYHLHFIPRYLNDGVKHLSNKEVLQDLNSIKEKLDD